MSKTPASRQKYQPGRTPLSATHPELAAQLHPTRNGTITPDDVVRSSKINVWWQCSINESHVWQATPDRRVYGKTGCPFCLNQKVGADNSLAVRYPEVASRWHPILNGDLTPDKVVATSGTKAWWQCPKYPEHVWHSIIRTVVNSKRSGCCYCYGKKADKHNSLATHYPEVAAQWHYAKNNGLTPEYVTSASGKKVWWQCPKNPKHQWQATIRNRTAKGQGCPLDNRLHEHFPLIAAQWHPTKNGQLNPCDLDYGSEKKVWWLCDRGHSFEVPVCTRTAWGTGCTICKTLAVKYPLVAKQWHPTLNGDLVSSKVSAGSNRKVWWLCSDKHAWQASIAAVVSCRLQYGSTGCPKCFNLKRSKGTTSLRAKMKSEWRQLFRDYEQKYEDTEKLASDLITFPASKGTSQTVRLRGPSLADQYPKVAQYWHAKRNGDLSPSQVGCGLRRKVWWRCPVKHEWQNSVIAQVRSMRCPYCTHRYVTNENSLAAKDPEVAREWHRSKNRRLWFTNPGSFRFIQNTRIPEERKKKNRSLTPKDVAFNSKERVWWQCASNHQWQDTVEHRVVRGRSCPECRQIDLFEHQSLAAMYPALVKLWHPSRNKISANAITPNSNQMVWWRCPKKADHVWEAPVLTVVRNHRAGTSSCPRCSPPQRPIFRNNLQVKCPEAARLWHPTKNKALTPSHVTFLSHKRVHWQCTTHPVHEWIARIRDLVKDVRNHLLPCPRCRDVDGQ